MRPPTPRKVTSASNSSRRELGLDPYGIYGTRSANRMRQAKQRRKLQMALWLLGLIGLAGAVMAAGKIQRVASYSSDWSLTLLARPSAPPAWDEVGGSLLIPTESGQLLAGQPAGDADLRPALQADFPLRAEPLVVDGVAYVACEDGGLYAVSLKERKQLWRFESKAAMTSRPAYFEYSVTVMPTPIPTPSSTRVPTTAPTPGPTLASTPSPTVGAGPQKATRKTVIAGNDGGLVSALDAGNGRLRWETQLPAPVGSGLAIARLGERTLVLVPLLSGLGSRGGLWCLDGRTGDVVWKFPDESKTFAAQLPAPVVSVEENSGRVYAANDSGAVFCLDLKTGRKIGWEKAYVAPAAGHDSAVLLRVEPLLEQYEWGTRLIVAGGDGGVRCFDTASGKLEWSYEAPDSIHCRPLALSPKGGVPVVLVGCDAAQVVALDARSGVVAYKLKTQGATSGILNDGESVVVVSGNGVVEKFGLR